MEGVRAEGLSPALRARIPCALCGGEDGRFLFAKGEYRYFRCPGCSLVYSDLELANPAELYDGLFESSWLEREVRRTLASRKQGIYRRQIRALMRQRGAIAGGGAVLDAGCGVGGFLAAARDLGLETAGIEVSELAAGHARAELGLDVRTGTCEDCGLFGRRFDLIRANALLEHLRSPLACLRALRACLDAGGVLFGMTLNARSWTFQRAGSAWRYLGMGGHITLFEPATLERCFAKAGFSRWRLWTSGYREERRRVPRALEQALGKLAALAGRGHRLTFEARP